MDVTPRKSEAGTRVGQRFDSADCIAGWRRASRGSTQDADLYCSAIVDRAIAACWKQGYETQAIEAMLAHVADTGGISGFKLAGLKARPRQVVSGSESVPDVWLHTFTRATYHLVRKMIEEKAGMLPAFVPDRVA